MTGEMGRSSLPYYEGLNCVLHAPIIHPGPKFPVPQDKTLFENRTTAGVVKTTSYWN